MSKSPVATRKSLLEKLDLHHPLHTGYLYKQAHVPPKNFNKRFFVLFPKVLVYYDNEKEFGRDVTSRTLAHRHKAILLDHLFLTKPDKKPKGAKFCFILHVPNLHNERHEIFLVADNRESRRTWMDKLQDQNPRLKESEHHHRNSSSSSATSSLLTVPEPRRLRADSVTPESIEDLTEEAQSIPVDEGPSDEET